MLLNDWRELVISNNIPLVITDINETCNNMFLGQWEGHVEDGRMFYIRYKYRVLTCTISDNATDEIGDAIDVNYLYERDLGREDYTILTQSDMLQALNKQLTKRSN